MFSKFIIASLFALVVLATAFALAVSATPFVTEQFVAEINKKARTWTADHTNQGSTIDGASREAIKRLLGVRGEAKHKLELRTYSNVDAMPTSFEAAKKWPQCPTILRILDQSACGSCWAMAAAESISDRYCTYGVNTNLELSPANLMECCWWCGSGCGGGQPADAYAYWTMTGLLTYSCVPYPFEKCNHHEVEKNHLPPCPKQMFPTPACSNGQCTNSSGSNSVHKGQKSWRVMGVQDYMQELLKNGPFEVAFSVYADFPTYRSGVYRRTSNDYLGGHAVKIIGWGEENGTPYWHIANSWNAQWGINGTFKILRGVNECGIEDSGVAGQP